jgi:hypothetical protein
METEPLFSGKIWDLTIVVISSSVYYKNRMCYINNCLQFSSIHHSAFQILSKSYYTTLHRYGLSFRIFTENQIVTKDIIL